MTIGPKKDYLSHLPAEVQIIIGHISPELLIEGQKTNKVLKALFDKKEVWVAIAKKMHITILDKEHPKEALLKQVASVNGLLKKYFPQVPHKAQEPLGKNVEIHNYIHAHRQEKPTIQAFDKLMNDVVTRKFMGDKILYAVQTFIDEGVLQKPGLNWKKYLFNALGQTDISTRKPPIEPREIFGLLLKEYKKNNPNDPGAEKLINDLWTIIRKQQNRPAMENLFSIGLTMNEKHFSELMQYMCETPNYEYMKAELIFRLLVEKLGQSKEKMLALINAVEKDLKNDENRDQVKVTNRCQQIREICEGKPILRSISDDALQDLHRWSFDDMKQLAKYCTAEEKLRIVGMFEKLEKSTLIGNLQKEKAIFL